MDIPGYCRSNCWNMVKLISQIRFDRPIVFSICTSVKVNFVCLIEPI